MVTWLARQEAVDLHTSYVQWYHHRSAVPGHDSGTSDLSDSDSEDEPDTVTTTQNPTAKHQEKRAVSGYAIAKNCPFPGTPLERIETEYGATEFLPAFTEFTRTNLPGCPFKPNRMDRYDIYKNIRITYQAPAHSDIRWHKDRIRTVIGRPVKGTKPAVAAHFDTAFIRDPEAPIDEQVDPRSISGMCCVAYDICGCSPLHSQVHELREFG
ncbi:hypothetical protein DAEQUDRAFT_239742 [Daedalea quercina L-15889]|uniref:Uncharacterized protein n=1 Tax=Daedalea quercina L-15889 TaxID=1314783 RepID=A0A165QQE1_9APHY|nr:hypothetical protein DAEQUDRAFT_239742 [Daedalea quercina L-15889]